SGSGGAESNETLVSDIYQIFERTVYSAVEGEATAFTEMAGEAIGFGGVIFGNRISSEPQIARPVAVWWIDAPSISGARPFDVVEPWGRLAFKLANGAVLYSHFFRADTVAAAKAITIDVSVFPENAGCGLVGYQGPFAAATVNQDNNILSSGRGFSYVVNPQI